MSAEPKQIIFEAPNAADLDLLLTGYSVERLLAQGGMGAVYLGQQTSLDRKVAIKVLPKEFNDDENFRDAFQDEARAMAKINHPNLIQVYDFGSIRGMLYIIMEYAESSSLFDLLLKEDLDHAYVAKVGSEIALGLQAAHNSDILHRDIKPANILLNSKKEVKISDFGLARPTGKTETGIIYGSKGYTAPEVLRNPEAVDVQADIFSVGVIIYELLTKSIPEKVYLPVQGLVNAVTDFDNIIRKAIHPSPKMRYKCAADLAEDLLELNQHLTKQANPGNSGNPLLRTGASLQIQPALSSQPKLTTQTVGTLNSNQKPIPTPQAIYTRGSGETTKPRTLSAPGSVNVTSLSGNRPHTPAKMGPPPSQFNKTFFINILIILILLVACFVAWEMIKTKKTDFEKKSSEIAEKNALANQADIKNSTSSGVSNTPEPISITTNKTTPTTTLANTSNDQPTEHKATIQFADKKQVSHKQTLQQLKSEQLNLLNGTINIANLPNNTITRGSQFYLYIDSPMTWHEADLFCNCYGGQIAAPPLRADAEFLRSHTSKSQAFWLGGGAIPGGTVRYIDGSPFTLDLSRVGNMKALFFQEYVNTGMKYTKEKLPFFIQWNVEGHMHSTLDARLIETYKTIDQLNPTYPPTTFITSDRKYLIAYRPMTFKQAEELALLAGGSLAIISNSDEAYELEKFMSKSLPPNTACWVGSRVGDDNTWENINYETDTQFLKQNIEIAPSTKFATLIHNGSELEHIGVPEKSLVNACIIEWSGDSETAFRNTLIPSDINDLKTLKQETTDLLKEFDILKKSQLELASKRLTWTIRTWKNGAKHVEREELDQDLTTVINKINDTGLSERLDTSALPEELTISAETCIKLYEKLKRSHKKSYLTIRDGYLINLKKILDRQSNKQSFTTKALRKEIDTITKSPDNFESLLSK